MSAAGVGYVMCPQRRETSRYTALELYDNSFLQCWRGVISNNFTASPHLLGQWVINEVFLYSSLTSGTWIFCTYLMRFPCDVTSLDQWDSRTLQTHWPSHSTPAGNGNPRSIYNTTPCWSNELITHRNTIRPGIKSKPVVVVICLDKSDVWLMSDHYNLSAPWS